MKTQSEMGWAVMSVRWHLFRMQLAGIFVVLCVCSMAFMVTELLFLHQALVNSMRTTATLLSFSLGPALAEYDETDAYKILKSLRSLEESVAGAYVVDSHQRRFAGYGETFEASILSRDSPKARYEFGLNYLYYSFPLRSGKERIGTLHIKATTVELKRQLWVYLLISLSVLMVGLWVEFRQSKRRMKVIADPLADLCQLVKKITKDADYSVKIAPLTERVMVSEIYDLSAELERMMREIQNRNSVIQENNLLLEKKVAERTNELKEAHKTLVQSGRLSALGEMAAGIAHEINNPLAIINARAGLLRALADKGQAAPESIAKAANQIEQIVEHISNIVRGLRNFSRDGSGDPFATAQISTIVNDTLALCRARFLNHGVDLRVLPYPETLTLDCRAIQLGQVLLNLLNNAYDAAGNLKERWVELTVEDLQDSVSISVTDSGKGISENIRTKIMEPFFTTKEVGKGTGLGLSISKGIVASHRGKLLVDEKCPHTRFVVILPKHQDVQEIPQQAA